MTRHRGVFSTLATLSLILLLIGCTPVALTGSTGAPGASQALKPPKVLRIGNFGEPDNIEGFGGTRGAGAGIIRNIAHNYLAVQTDRLDYQPQIAEALPDVAKGTWIVYADGRMDTTWKLRPNVSWQDGTPFTSDDLVFSYAVRQDPNLPQNISSTSAFMSGVDAPDPTTLVVHWSQPYIHAEQAAGLSPLAKHLLEQPYNDDTSTGKQNFIASPFFRTGFIGLGPYRLTHWEQGSFAEFDRFDGYLLGRPPLDTVVVQFFGDPNALVGAILSESVDLVVPPGVDIETARAVQQRWEGTDNVVRFDTTGRFTFLEMQYRPDLARPVGGLSNPDVRRGFYSALDRQALVDELFHGLPMVADSWVAPNDADRPALEDAISKFPFDLARAQQFLTQAGWVKGSDGVLVSSTGDRFELSLRASQTGGTQLGKEKQLAVIADFWKAVGVDPSLDLATIGTNGDRGYEATRPGLWLLANIATNPESYVVRLHSHNVGTQATNYTGQNLGGYVNAKVDDLFDRYNVTVDPRARLDIHRALLQEIMGQVVVMPLYLDVSPVLMLKGVNQSVVGATTDYRFFEWDRI